MFLPTFSGMKLTVVGENASSLGIELLLFLSLGMFFRLLVTLFLLLVNLF